MAFHIVRNDLVRMQVDAIVNTANEKPRYSTGIDTAVYKAAGEEALLAERVKIGYLEEGEVAITPGFQLPAKYIIHAVSPRYKDGHSGEEDKLRYCYRNSLLLAKEKQCKSIAFPLISTGNFGYPKEEAMRIAVDEIHAFLLSDEMEIYLVVFDTASTALGLKLAPALDSYIDQHYVEEKKAEEYGDRYFGSVRKKDPNYNTYIQLREEVERKTVFHKIEQTSESDELCECDDFSFWEENEYLVNDRIQHMSDTFQQYLFYLIEKKGLTNTEVYKRALLTKQRFSKIKVNPQYHPDKTTALRLCIGAKLNLDETKDLLARAGYALSPCDKMDIIFSFFIEHEVFDMLEIDIALEEHGLPCFIE